MGKRYCVIFYVGHFQYLHFGPISVKSLIFTLTSLIFTPNFFSPYPIVCCCALGARMRGGGGVVWLAKILRIRAQNYSGTRFNVSTQGPMPGPSSWSLRGLVSQALWIMRKCNLATAIEIRTFIHPLMCKMGLSIFAAMIKLKSTSSTRASLHSILFTEITNR